MKKKKKKNLKLMIASKYINITLPGESPFFGTIFKLTKENMQRKEDQQEKRIKIEFRARCVCIKSTFEKWCNIICARMRCSHLTMPNVTPNGICVDVLNKQNINIPLMNLIVTRLLKSLPLSVPLIRLRTNKRLTYQHFAS